GKGAAVVRIGRGGAGMGARPRGVRRNPGGQRQRWRVSVRPVFVLSLPRSGSTLLQRMLASHPEIATSSETWLLLPQLYALRPHGAQAEYGHRTAARAVQDFCSVLPGGQDAYIAEVRRSVLALYELAADGAS